MRDAFYALRTLIRNPGFTAVAVLALSLGIGANTAVFSIVNGVLLRPLPCKDPDRVVLLGSKYPNMGLHQGALSVPDYFDRRDQSKTMEAIAASHSVPLNLTGGGEPERVFGSKVTASFFPLMGVEPALGRWISPDEDQPGRDQTAVLSHSLWTRRFGGDQSIVNRPILLDGRSYTVVGVMPPKFQIPFMDLWVPIAFTPEQKSDSNRGYEFLLTFGRMRQGVSLAAAAAEMDTIAAQVPLRLPERREFLLKAGWGAVTVPVREQLIGNVRPVLLILLGAVGFVLLIACANVANLMLARATVREKEISIRLAMGASHWRLVRLLLAESVALALLGGLGGLVIASWALEVIPRGLPPQVAPLVDFMRIGIDSRVLAFTLLVSAGSGILFGLAPARQAVRHDLADALREGGRTTTGSFRKHLRGFLVAAEVALALIVLIGAGLLYRSLQRVLAVDPGFDPTGRLTAQISLSSGKYSDARQQAAFFRDLLRNLRTLPGVRHAGATMLLPLMGGSSTRAFAVDGYQPAPGERNPLADYRVISPGYAAAMGMRLLEGRDLDERDDVGAPLVVLIDEKTAKRFWPGASPLRKRIRFASGTSQEWRQVVGVVASVKNSSLERAGREQIYAPFMQAPIPDMFVVIETAGNPFDLSRALRAEVAQLDRDLPLYMVRSLSQVVESSLWTKRLPMQMLGLFAAIALGLAAVGIYGVISYSVSQRTHEIGIRMALGAERSDVLALVIRQGMTVVGMGVIGGLAGSLVVTRFLSGILFGVDSLDPFIFCSVTAALSLIALIACWVPARRATRVDPLIALRHE